MANARPPKDILRGYYDKGKITNKINNTKVDSEKLQANLDYYGSGIEEYKSSIYHTYGMRQYKNKEEYVRDMNEHSPLSREVIEERWRMYQHRDKLIESGQYEELRLQQYKDVYIKSMKASGFSDEEIYNIERLSLQQFKKMVAGIDFDKTNINKTFLPILGEFLYMYKQEGLATDPNIEEYHERLRQAFTEAGIPYIEDNEEIQGIKNKRNRKAMVKKLTKLIPQRERRFISNYSEESRENDVVDFATSDKLTFKNGRPIVRRFPEGHKYAGKLYIPGIGTEFGKNGDLVLKIAEPYIKNGWL